MINAELEKIQDALGRVNGIVAHLETNEHINQVTRRVATAVTDEMYNLIDSQVQMEGGTSNLSHVYEFDAFRSGDMANNRLYRLNVISTSPKDSVISWNFVASRKPIATPAENKALGFNELSEDMLSRFKDKKYIFRQQAQMEEYGETVSIAPRSDNKSKVLAFPYIGGPTGPAPKTFRNQSVLYDLDTEAPGDHVGQFQEKFVSLSERTSDRIVENIQPQVDAIVAENMARAGKVRTKSVSVAFKTAENQAKNMMRSRLKYETLERGQ